VPTKNQNKAAKKSGQYLELSDRPQDHLQHMHRLMGDDLVLYDEALDLLIQHHHAATFEMNGLAVEQAVGSHAAFPPGRRAHQEPSSPAI